MPNRGEVTFVLTGNVTLEFHWQWIIVVYNNLYTRFSTMEASLVDYQ